MSKRDFCLSVAVRTLLVMLMGAGFFLAACSSASKPAVIISSPPSGTQVTVGQDVVVTSTATDSKGVIRVDLLVDSVPVRTDEAPGPQASFNLQQTWKASTPGSHTLSVVAYNKDAIASDPAAITIVVQASPAPGPTAAPTGAPVAPTKPAPVAPTAPPPTAAPTAVPTPAPPTPAPCVHNAAFVADVTVPDGSSYLPGQQFDKVWRLSNSGNCAWGTNFQFVFVGGEAMSTIQAVAVPNIAPGNTADFKVPMVAPATYGAHSGSWRLRDGAGNLFGVTVGVKINVVAPQPTACTPQISSFTADRTTINRGESTTLRWGLVSNAQVVEIDNGIGGVATPGQVVVAPNQTTTYTLYATCGGTRVAAKVTITVNQPQPPTAVPPTAEPQRRNISGAWASGNYSMQLQEALGCGGPVCGVTGSYSEYSGGTPVVATVNGTVNVSTGDVSLTIVEEIPGAPAKTFNGKLSGDSNRLSGNLSDVGQLTFTRQ